MVLPLLAAGLGLVGTIASAKSASKAADAQQETAADQIAYSEQTRDLIRNDLAPYRESGETAFNALMSEYGLGDAPAGYQGYQATPSYQFQQDEARRGIEGSAAAQGGLYSGATMEALQDRSQGIASMDYSNYLTGLQGLAGSGQNAAAMSANAYTNSAQTVNSALGAQGNAAAAGAIGVGNAVSGGLNQLGGYFGYQQAQGGGNGITVGGTNSLFGGSSWGI